MSENKKYYWLRLKRDFFTDKRIKKLRNIAGGDTYTIIYLKMQLLSLQDEGYLYFENVEDTFAEEIALEIDEDVENVKTVIAFLTRNNLLVEINENIFELIETRECIGSETDSARRVRNHRKRKKEELGLDVEETKKIAKTNAERQRQYRAKINCKAKQYVPYIEDYINNKRYNGNYYVVLQRDKCKCVICGSIENLCVHHIDGYDEKKPQNNYINKMITLCRNCHSNIHAGQLLDEDILNSIDYYEYSNEMLPCNIDVTKCNTEKEKEKDIEIKKEKNIKKEKYGKYERVKLTRKEYEKLIDEFGEDFINKQIELLDEYVESNNNKNKYSNFNLVLRKSIRENWFKKKETAQERIDRLIKEAEMEEENDKSRNT